MIKKIFLFNKFLLVSTGWSYLYFTVVRYLFQYFWNFDIFITEYWVTIAEFWNHGGVINKLKDVAFISAIAAIIPLWLYTLVKLIRFEYVKIIIYPIEMYDKYMMKKFGRSSRISFKNLTTSSKDLSFEEMVDLKMKEITKKDENKELEADKIRSVIKEKIKSKK